MRGPYDILGIPIGSSAEEIRAAYKRMAIKTHPDKTGGDDNEFKEVRQAYETLTNPPVFAARFGPGFTRFHTDPVFSNMFKTFHTVFSERVPVDRFQMSIPLSAVVHGTSQRITIFMNQKWRRVPEQAVAPARTEPSNATSQ